MKKRKLGILLLLGLAMMSLSSCEKKSGKNCGGGGTCPIGIVVR